MYVLAVLFILKYIFPCKKGNREEENQKEDVSRNGGDTSSLSFNPTERNERD